MWSVLLVLLEAFKAGCSGFEINQLDVEKYFSVDPSPLESPGTTKMNGFEPESVEERFFRLERLNKNLTKLAFDGEENVLNNLRITGLG